jgi:exopolyphosphatase/guanosine-5'-triphosphate,3'-diphosphate pyrophosphatase
MTAAMPGVLGRTSLSVVEDALVLHLPTDYAFLNGDHLRNRLRQLADEAGFENWRVKVG